MNEADARAAMAALPGVSRETLAKLDHFVAMVVDENTRQNLIGARDIESVWRRHILDSAQLCAFAPQTGTWVDIGTGGGFPGMVVALLRDGPVHLIEPRRKRADFLRQVATELSLGNAQVHQLNIARLEGVRADVISARALAPLPELLIWSHKIAHSNTVWLLPKGKNAKDELALARQSWQGTFHVERSATDADSFIIIATGVRPKRPS